MLTPYHSVTCNGIDSRVHCTNTIAYGSYHHNKISDIPLGTFGTNVPLLLMVSLFKAAPYALKPRIYDNAYWLGANEKLVRAYQLKVPEWGFLSVLARESNTDRNSKTFKFIHLNIPHRPFAMNSDCMLQPGTATFYTESVLRAERDRRAVSSPEAERYLRQHQDCAGFRSRVVG